MSCYLAVWENCNGVKGSTWLCATTVSTASGGCGVQWVIDGVNHGFSERSTTFQSVDWFDPSLIPADYPNYGAYVDCAACHAAKKYDCINGQCKESTTYNTPGIFADSAACQSKCSLASNNCDGQCITNEEYSQIQSAIAQKQRDCG